jgi:hypothetical protein
MKQETKNGQRIGSEEGKTVSKSAARGGHKPEGNIMPLISLSACLFAQI